MGFLNFLFGSKETEEENPGVRKFMVLTSNGDFEMEVRGDGRIGQKMIKEALQKYTEEHDLEKPPEFLSYWEL